MKKKNIAMILILLILLAITLIGTYAYKIYTQDTMKNTFIIGDVAIEFYEKDENGNKVNTLEQEYILERDKTYHKNMVVNIQQGSQSCYVYIVMQNDLAAIESPEVEQTLDNMDAASYTPIATQISQNGWKERSSGKENIKIYWQAFESNGRSGEIEFMESFRTKSSFDYDLVRMDGNGSPMMNFTIYAIEKDSNLTESNAWALLKGEFPDLASY